MATTHKEVTHNILVTKTKIKDNIGHQLVVLTIHHHEHGIDPLVTASRITKVEVGAIPY